MVERGMLYPPFPLNDVEEREGKNVYDAPLSLQDIFLLFNDDTNYLKMDSVINYNCGSSIPTHTFSTVFDSLPNANCAKKW